MTDSKLELIEEIVILTYDLGLDRKKCPVTRLSRQILAHCEPEWVPMSERLPDEKETVLLWYSRCQLPYDTHICIGRNPKKHGRIVTHWKPLPLPPEQPND